MYKIAIASSDGVNIDMSFGGAVSFDIYEVSGKEYHLAEKREVPAEKSAANKPAQEDMAAGNRDCGGADGCSGSGQGCGMGIGACGDGSGVSPKVEFISDCRCIVCKKIGFYIAKQLEKKAISGFDVECSTKEALSKITNYFYRIDSHQPLRE